jgi:hypothetical protein
MCPIPNGSLDRAISLYSSKIIDKEDTLRTVSNTGIYMHVTGDKVGTVYLVQWFSTFVRPQPDTGPRSGGWNTQT